MGAIKRSDRIHTYYWLQWPQRSVGTLFLAMKISDRWPMLIEKWRPFRDPALRWSIVQKAISNYVGQEVTKGHNSKLKFDSEALSRYFVLIWTIINIYDIHIECENAKNVLVLEEAKSASNQNFVFHFKACLLIQFFKLWEILSFVRSRTFRHELDGWIGCIQPCAFINLKICLIKTWNAHIACSNSGVLHSVSAKNFF